MHSDTHPTVAQAPPLPANAEADHRVANKLALLHGIILHEAREVEKRTGPIERGEIGTLLRTISHRVETMGKLHKILAMRGTDGTVDVVRLVGEICTNFSAILPPGRMALSMDCAGAAEIPAEHASHLGRIITELLTNAVKYAHPTGIPVLVHVTCRNAPSDTIIVEIEDDGIGLPEGFDLQNGGGLGFRIMRSLAAQLSGRIEFEQTHTGMRARLTMPRTAIDDASNVVAFPTAIAL